jgi:hypothetical protein
MIMTTTTMMIACASLPLVLGGCLLDPLVDDEPTASVHILPAGAEVPRVADDPELVHQILVHDGLDDGDLEEAGGVVPLLDGRAGGEKIFYWDFGNAPRISAPVYILVEDTGDGPVPIADHPHLYDSLPGDPVYSPVRRIQHVRVTPAYRGELLTTLRALTDAIEIGLVEEPETTGLWMNAPIVAPGTTLDVGDGETAAPVEVFAGGYRAERFVFGGARGIQPLRSGGVPTGQASLLRAAGEAAAKETPIFQLGVPLEAPSDGYNYTPVTVIVEVDLANGAGDPDELDDDAELFERSGSGAITGVTTAVDDFEVTETIRNLQLQFEGGAP